MEPKKEEKGGFTVNGKKLDVGPAMGFDQGSAYDSMNSEEMGKGKSGAPNGGGSYAKNSETMDGRDYSGFDYEYEKGGDQGCDY
jgi:hypothetical protein